MDIQGAVRPIDKGVEKAVLLALAIAAISIGAAIFSSAFVLASYDIGSTLLGLVIIWISSLAFFYAVITEEHTMKQLFLRQGYFFTGLIAMLMGLFFVSLAGFSYKSDSNSIMEFGLLVLISGAGLILLSAQKTRDYSKRSGFFGLFSGILLILGGIVVGSINAAFGGVFIVVFSAVWLGLRSRTAI